MHPGCSRVWWKRITDRVHLKVAVWSIWEYHTTVATWNRQSPSFSSTEACRWTMTTASQHPPALVPDEGSSYQRGETERETGISRPVDSGCGVPSPHPAGRIQERNGRTLQTGSKACSPLPCTALNHTVWWSQKVDPLHGRGTEICSIKSSRKSQKQP